MKNNKGFTLIELIATILVLALILGITIYVALNVIKKGKEKTYNITKNEVETNADNYLTENNQRLFYLIKDEDTEYQCITVENLIDYGYLDNDVTKSLIDEHQNVKPSDYVYIERDINTKAITKTEYVDDGSDYLEVCPKAVSALGDIIITTNPSKDKWSKYKDITIIYKLKNLNDQRKLIDYSFNHSYTGVSSYDENSDTFLNNTKTKHVVVTSNGTLLTDIKNNGVEIVSKGLEINKIDTIGPVITKGTYTNNKARHTLTYPLVVTDNGSGVDYNSFTKEDIIVKINNTTINDYSLKHDGDGKYSLTVNSDLYNGKLTLTIPRDKVFDMVIDESKNGNSEITIDTNVTFDNTYIITYNMNGGTGTIPNTTYVYAESGTINLTSSKPTRTGYTFLGWSENKNAKAATYASNATYNKNIKKDVTLYAIWKDVTNPTCSISKSNTGSESGVNLKITCSDNSGSCTLNKTTDNNKKSGTYTYTATDPTGNKGTCSTTISGYNCNSYRYACGSYACGSYQCGSYVCGQSCYHLYVLAHGSCYYRYCPSYCTAYCTSYCTGYKTCYK